MTASANLGKAIDFDVMSKALPGHPNVGTRRVREV